MSNASESPDHPYGGDGAVDSLWRRVSRKPVASIFVHAGAGYHSAVNDKVHLKACTDAARVGMAFLKAGATAPQAVEAAVRCLEDKEVTNAGFGSNLNLDGMVECDATIVDHLGRSGACGAVAGVKNPISLAKKILDTSSQPLSLRRVPPNILVGAGAKEFAEEHGIKTVRNEFMVSRNAKDRYLRWSEDLRRVEARKRPAATYPDKSPTPRRTPSPTAYDWAAKPAHNDELPDHTSAILTGTWNEGQPDSPERGRSPLSGSPTREAAPTSPRSSPGGASKETADAPKSPVRNPLSLLGEELQRRGSSSTPIAPVDCVGLNAESPYIPPRARFSRSANDGPAGHDADEVDMTDDYEDHPTNAGDKPTDMITDTVGAIAIDLHGNIAAGSSSGGIGMKHRGRTGPAALVGVGTAVIPTDAADELGTSVAAVTSGTGEHMATCQASSKCAERLFQGTRRGPGGRDVPEEDEHAILESFIVDDFMNHPGVRNQPSAGAIGVMAVRKDRTGVYFHFAHNTDSFALASLSSAERQPLCVMSRLGRTGRVAQGGRKVRLS